MDRPRSADQTTRIGEQARETADANRQEGNAVVQNQLIDNSSIATRRTSASSTPSAMERIQAAIGVKTEEVSESLLSELVNLHHPPDTASEKQRRKLLFQSIAVLAEFQPTDTLQAHLCVQMIGTHRTAMEFITRATAPGQTVEGADLNVLRAMRLMRLFAEQTDALSRLKGKSGQQRVVVEHVTVSKNAAA
jgi:hypothetical protein